MNDNLAARFYLVEYLNRRSKMYYSIPTIPVIIPRECCTLDLCREYELIKRII